MTCEFHTKIYKGCNSVKNVGGVLYLFSAHCLMMFYTSTKFHVHISKGFCVTELT